MDADHIHRKVVVIRLPANFQGRANVPATTSGQGNGPQVTDINQIPDEIIAEMVSNQYKQDHPNIDTIEENGVNPNMMIDNSDPKQMAMYSLDHPELATNTSHTTVGLAHTRTRSNPSAMTNEGQHHHNQQTAHRPAGSAAETEESRNKDDETVQFKNYSPKQREWMLVVLSYSRGLLAKPFEMKLQDVVIEKAREVLRENAPTFKMTNRIPTPKTLRGIWKNLWKHPERTVGTVKKGGRPRIDPAIKRQKRNEREKRRRAALRQSKQMGSGGDYYQMDQQPATPKRSQRGH